MFALKKLVSALLMPAPLLLLLLTAGMIWLLLGRRRPAAWLLGIAWLWAMLIFWSPVPYWMTSALEAPFTQHVPAKQDFNYIVVMGGGHNSDPRQPVSSRLKSFSLARISEGVRLAKQYPQARLLLSGYAGAQQQSNAEVMREFALEMGIDAERITLFPAPRDTAEEAALLCPRIRHQRALLVTSAFHMRRALKLFGFHHCYPTPAPTHFLSVALRDETNDNRSISSYLPELPRSADLIMLEYAWHEWLGIVWADITQITQQFSLEE